MMVALAGGVAEAVTGGAAVLPPHADRCLSLIVGMSCRQRRPSREFHWRLLPAYITVVNLALPARTRVSYEGDLDLSRTGLEYRVIPGVSCLIRLPC